MARLASVIASPSAATAGFKAAGLACSTASAALATAHAPIPRAEPLSVCASVATPDGGTCSPSQAAKASVSCSRIMSGRPMRVPP